MFYNFCPNTSVAYDDGAGYDYLALLGEGGEDGVYNNPGVLPKMGQLYQESLLDPDGSCHPHFDSINELHSVHHFDVFSFSA